MRATPASEPRQQTLGEEIANSISHGLGAIATLAAMPYLLMQAAEKNDPTFFIGTCIFAATAVLLYLSSTIYHALTNNRAKRAFQIIEHSAIFCLIAGTYSPFTLGVLRGPWGWSLFGMIWSLALIGVLIEVLGQKNHPIITTSLYLLMGWLITIAVKPLYQQTPDGLMWLLAGGIAYTVGVAFFVADSRVRYAHFIWHLFVLAGTTFHYFAVLWYAA
jgi:hemolysin III